MNGFRRAFSIDLRSLALFRIALSIAVVGDLLSRAGDIEAWYTDFGILPVAALDRRARWTLHALGSSVGYETFLFALAAIACVVLLIGLYTRVALVVCWLLTLSLLARTPHVQGASATALRLALFWSLVLPLGARWSIDSAREARPAGAEGANTDPLFSVATFAILLQVFLIYPMTVYEKLRPPCCWRNLSAVHQILNDDRVATWLNPILRGIPWAHRPMTAGVLLLEGVPPFLALLGTPRLRTAAALAMMTLHAVLIPSAVRLGFTFPMIMTTLWTLYLPPWFWDEGLPRAVALVARKLPRAHALLADVGRRAVALAARIPRKKKVRTRRFDEPVHAAASVATGVAVVGWLWMSAAGIVSKKRSNPPEPLGTIARTLGLRQGWKLYIQPKESHQYVFAATLRDGARVDLRRNGAPVDWKRNAEPAPNSHWTKFETTAAKRAAEASRYTDYLARRWDRDHPTNRVVDIELVMKARSPKRPWRYELLWQRDFNPENALTTDRAPKLQRRLGERVRIDVDARRLRDRRCKLAGQDAGCAAPTDPLLPFFTARGGRFLARASEVVDLRRRGRIAATCTLENRSTARNARVKFADDSPWLSTRARWTIATLDCERPAKKRAR